MTNVFSVKTQKHPTICVRPQKDVRLAVVDRCKLQPDVDVVYFDGQLSDIPKR